MKKVPFDFIASLDIPEWRENFKWMLAEHEINRLYEGQNRRIRTFLENLIDQKKKQHLLLLALPAVKYHFNNTLYNALSAQAAEKSACELVSSLAEMDFLKTGDRQFLLSMQDVDPVKKIAQWPLLRRIARTLSWVRWWRLPAVIMRPQILAIGHNEILRRKAVFSTKRIYFYQAELILRKARKNYNKSAIDDMFLDKLCDEVFDLFIDKDIFNEIYLARIRLIYQHNIKPHIIRSFHDLEALYQYKQLPQHIWIANAHNYTSRTLALAVLKNGGYVTSFGHASGSVLSPDSDSFLVSQLAVTSEYVALTRAENDMLDRQYSPELRARYHNFRISYIDGSPKFKQIARETLGKRSHHHRHQPTVVYASTIIGWSRSYVCASNMVYLDWQLRLAAMLKTMDIELICQPHPEGIFIDKNILHPLRKEFDIPYRRFEEIIAQADVFLVDYIHSTAFGEMLVTDKPIVRIAISDDSPFDGVREDLRPLLDTRCRKVAVTIGDDNLPYIDKAALQHALLDNWQEKMDSKPFQELLLGGLVH